MLNNRLVKEPIPSGNVTLRFDGQTLESLRKEAEQKRISLNTLASQIFKTHMEFGGAAAKAGMVLFPKSLLVRLMNKLSEDMLLMIKRSYTIEAFVDLIESWIRVSGFSYTHDVSGSTHYFAIQHEMGKRWSVYHAELFKFVFSDLGAKWADFETTDNTVTFNVEV